MKLKLFLLNLGNTISYFTNPIVLGIIYLVLFTPISLIYKILKRDPLSLNIRDDLPSYWIKREKVIQNMKKEY